MKNIYFVRHGESDANIGGEYMGPHTALSEDGKRQIGVVAERFTRIPIDVVLTSTFIRAIETGKAIAERTGVPLALPSELFGEREHPKEAIGLRVDSPEYNEIRKITWELFGNGQPPYSTEESFDVLKERADKALKHLENMTEENIAVASHSVFIKFVVLRAVLVDFLTPQLFVKFLYSSRISNTGITHMTFGDGMWCLNQWNDNAHLG